MRNCDSDGRRLKLEKRFEIDTICICIGFYYGSQLAAAKAASTLPGVLQKLRQFIPF
jgi:hypothetical protein